MTDEAELVDKLGRSLEHLSVVEQDRDDWHAKAINLARANGRKEREIRELKARLHVAEAERGALTLQPFTIPPEPT